MRAAVWLFLLAMVLGCGLAKGVVYPPEYGDRPALSPGDNAAFSYAPAADLYDKLSPADQALLRTPIGKHADPRALTALHGRVQPIMDQLRKAQKISMAYWGPDPQDTQLSVVQTVHASDLKRLQNLTCVTHWEADYLFEKDPATAVGDLATEAAIGRTDIQNLEGLDLHVEIQMDVLNLLETNLTRIPRSAADDISVITDNPTELRDADLAFGDDSEPYGEIVLEFDDPATRTDSYVQKIIDTHHYSEPDPAHVDEMIKWVLGGFPGDLTQRVYDSEAQCEAWYNKKAKSAPADPLAGELLKELSQRLIRARTEIATCAVLNAATLLEWGHVKKAKGVIDPATLKPLGFKRTKRGTQITSAMKDPFLLQKSSDKKDAGLSATSPGGSAVSISVPAKSSS